LLKLLDDVWVTTTHVSGFHDVTGGLKCGRPVARSAVAVAVVSVDLVTGQFQFLPREFAAAVQMKGS